MTYLNKINVSDEQSETPSEQIGSGIAGGAASGAVIALVGSALPIFVILSSVGGAVFGGLLTAWVAERNR